MYGSEFYAKKDSNEEKQEVGKKEKEKKYFKWSFGENTLYVEFLEKNPELFANEKERRKKKCYLEMSKYIMSRNSDQCRIHHQKMRKKYQTIEEIIENLVFDR